jgi:hypothetical protein
MEASIQHQSEVLNSNNRDEMITVLLSLKRLNCMFHNDIEIRMAVTRDDSIICNPSKDA